MINFTIWNDGFDVIADFKTRCVRIGEDQDSVPLGKTAKERRLFAVFENSKAIGRSEWDRPPMRKGAFYRICPRQPQLGEDES